MGWESRLFLCDLRVPHGQETVSVRSGARRPRAHSRVDSAVTLTRVPRPLGLEPASLSPSLGTHSPWTTLTRRQSQPQPAPRVWGTPEPGGHACPFWHPLALETSREKEILGGNRIPLCGPPGSLRMALLTPDPWVFPQSEVCISEATVA